MSAPTAHDCIADPAWLPFDIDIRAPRIQWIHCDEALIRASSFLDARMPGEGRAMALTDAGPAQSALTPTQPIAWLWHTSFCGSTFVARALHLSPLSIALREPMILRRLADERDAGHSVDTWLAPVSALLGRPWHSGGRVVVKPTHAALNLAPDLMALSPESVGVVLTSSLEEFLLSHFRKTHDTLAKIPVLAARALRAGTMAARLPAPALNPPDWMAAAALQWVAQQHLVNRLAERFSGRITVVQWNAVQADAPAAIWHVADSLRLGLPGPALEQQARQLGTRHAKSSSLDFNVQSLLQSNRQLASEHREALLATQRWADTWLMPSLA